MRYQLYLEVPSESEAALDRPAFFPVSYFSPPGVLVAYLLYHKFWKKAKPEKWEKGTVPFSHLYF